MTTPTDNIPTPRDLGFYTEDETAAIYGLNNKLTLRNWRAAGVGPEFTKPQRNLILYPVAGVHKDLKRKTVHPGGKSTG